MVKNSRQEQNVPEDRLNGSAHVFAQTLENANVKREIAESVEKNMKSIRATLPRKQKHVQSEAGLVNVVRVNVPTSQSANSQKTLRHASSLDMSLFIGQTIRTAMHMAASVNIASSWNRFSAACSKSMRTCTTKTASATTTARKIWNSGRNLNRPVSVFPIFENKLTTFNTRF